MGGIIGLLRQDAGVVSQTASTPRSMRAQQPLNAEWHIVSRGDIDASPTNCWYHTDPLLGHSTNALGASGRLAR